jgi:hypothetical protein
MKSYEINNLSLEIKLAITGYSSRNASSVDQPLIYIFFVVKIGGKNANLVSEMFHMNQL